MDYVIYYDKNQKSWWAYWVDESNNQVGDSVNAYQKEWCLIYLGMNFNPKNREIDEG